MKIRRLISTLALLLTSLYSIAQGDTPYCIENRFSPQPLFDASDISAALNVGFGAAMRWPAQVMDTLRMDIYYPSADADPLTKRPFIMLIHGGAFLGGSRDEMRPMAEAFARRGFVAATMSYRLGWDCPPESGLLICAFCSSEAEKLKVAAYRSVQDGRAAMRFIAAHADDYGIDADALFIGGTSAGAIAAIHTAYLSQAAADAFCPDCVDAVGTLDGVVNTLSNDFSIKGVINNCGAVVGLDILAADSNIPVISFHDENDCIVPSAFGHALGCFNCTAFLTGSGSQLIHQRLGEQAGCTSLSLRQNSISHCSFPMETVVARSTCFIKRLMCGECPNESTTSVTGVVDCSGLVDVSSPVAVQPAFRMFPNPTGGEVTIVTPASPSEVWQVQLSNAWGQTLQQNTWTGTTSLTLSLDGLPAGIYLVALIRPDGQARVQRLVKQ